MGLASKIYAKSLFELSLDNEIIKTELKSVLETFTSELYTFFSNPAVSINAKLEILDEIFSGKVKHEILAFLKLLAENNRIEQLSEIYVGFVEKLNEVSGILDVEITSALELDNDLKQKILGRLSEKLKKTIEPKWTVSEDIIAGLVIKIGDDVIDTSMKNKLDNLSKYIRS